MRRLALVAILSVLTPWAGAQSLTGNAPHFISRGPVVHAVRGGSLFSSEPRAPREFHRPFPLSTLLYPFGALADFSYDTGYPVASEPPIIVIQPPTVAEKEKDTGDRQPQIQALLIELQGGRYVRLANGEGNGAVQEFPAPLRPTSSKAQAQTKSRTAQPAIAANTTRELLPAILIFRDGHTEQVRNYTIADGIIYAQGDYYTDGYWTKKIDLKNLNLPETIKSNESRNVHFILPTSPIEVITHP